MYDPECVRLLGVLFLFSFLQAAKGQSLLTPNKIARADIEGAPITVGSNQALVSGSLQSFLDTSDKVVLIKWLV